jgi:MFS family permease
MLLMLPLIIGPAVNELLGAAPGTPPYNRWVGILFWVPAICGGIFGLIGGYLTDRLGRLTVLIGSIVLYGVGAFATGFVTSMEMFLFLRCVVFVGVCVEFVAAVTWMAELFPDPKQREAVVGYTQTAQSLGGVMVAAAYAAAVTFAHALPVVREGQEAWRYTMMSGIIPVILVLALLPFLPESPVWRQKKKAGTLKRPNPAELFKPAFRRTTIVTMIMMACVFGAATGAIQQMPRIVPGLPELQGLPRPAQQQTVSLVQTFQEFGGMAGRFLLAFLAIRIVTRRGLLRFFQVPGMILLPLVFIFPATQNLEVLKWGIFLVAMTTIAQMSFWGNYLPRVYPTHLRGTGESFAANVGGRMLGNGAALATTSLVPLMPGANPGNQLAYAAAIVGLTLYVIGFIASFWLPEPQAEELPE